jgi:hypothetical protein
VSVGGGRLKHVRQPCLEALGGVGRQPEAAGDRVGGPEADPEDVLRESVGVRAHQLERAGAVAGVRLGRDARGDPVAGEEDHQLLDAAVGGPGVRDPAQSPGPDPGNRKQTLRLALDDVEGLDPELVHDPGGDFRSDAAHPPAGEELPDAILGGGQHRHPAGDLELLAEAGVDHPAAAEAEPVTGTTPSSAPTAVKWAPPSPRQRTTLHPVLVRAQRPHHHTLDRGPEKPGAVTGRDPESAVGTPLS